MRLHAKTVDEYISMAPPEVRSKLKELRGVIRKTAPSAIEKISYGMPNYDYKGALVWFGRQKDFIGLYLRPPVIAEHRRELARYKTTKSAVHLPLGERLPLQLVKKLVRARMRKNEAGE
jgi:uncharacterized protein YdhG (YjbR/CyaY superfamily)